jgi:AraC-like DNA-binding protein
MQLVSTTRPSATSGVVNTTPSVMLALRIARVLNTTIAAAAAQVGYASPFGFSTAFKRRYGISPTAHRQHDRASM